MTIHTPASFHYRRTPAKTRMYQLRRVISLQTVCRYDQNHHRDIIICGNTQYCWAALAIASQDDPGGSIGQRTHLCNGKICKIGGKAPTAFKPASVADYRGSPRYQTPNPSQLQTLQRDAIVSPAHPLSFDQPSLMRLNGLLTPEKCRVFTIIRKRLYLPHHW